MMEPLPEQTTRDKRVELVHIAVLIGGLLAISNYTFTSMDPSTPLIYPLGLAFVWVAGYYSFVKRLPRRWSGTP